MARARFWLALGSFLPISLAGCLSELPPAVEEGGHEHGNTPASEWVLSLAKCEEGGFVASSYQAGSNWVRQNIRPEIGPEYLAAVPRTGNWHNGIHCQGGSFNGSTFGDFQFGWVGVGIEAPMYDPGGADQHFILAGLGLPEGEVRNALRAVVNADISQASGATVSWMPGGIVETIYADQDKGVYGGKGPIAVYRENLPERTTRFWWTVPANGERLVHDHHGGEMRPQPKEGGFVPVFWDLRAAVTTQWSSPSDRSSHTTHTGTNDHGSGPVTQGEIGEINSNVIYHYPELTVSFGGIIDGVVLETEWVH